MLPRAALTLVLLVISAVSSADSMRCGQSIVNETVTVAELLEKCGEPTNKDVKYADVLARNSNGSSRKIGTQTIERWRYARGSRSLPMEVTIVDGKIRSLERVE